tara:strand:- start:1572 stop:2777 length:1206 start_codon:yes stop_codon:yes gene_type:complete
LRDIIFKPLKNLRRLNRLTNFNKNNLLEDDIIWALKEISFEVNHGEVVGVIGENGAGKSTLLKIISQITNPTSGKIVLNGRVASLLEVGTGFHPELTGRENVYLNGTILGMTKNEIDQKLDEIIEFSGVEKFLDTPVKRYSSGMRVRLAFSVAAYLDPEILLVDEVLAVGDYAFQQKCLGKMDEVSKKGKTVLFVSHQLAMIQELCNRAILLEKGKIILSGSVKNVIQTYVKQSNEKLSFMSFKDEALNKSKEYDNGLEFKDIQIQQDGMDQNIFTNCDPITIIIQYYISRKFINFRVFIDLIDDYKNLIFRSFHDDMNKKPTEVSEGKYIAEMVIPAYLLAPKSYSIVINAGIHNEKMFIKGGIKLPLTVKRSGLMNKAYSGDPIRGIIAPSLSWTNKKV